MNERRPGDLVACRWEAGDAGSFRVAEIVAVSAMHVWLWMFGDPFACAPAQVDVSRLRRIRLHETRGGGPIPVPRAEFSTWRATPVRRTHGMP